MPDTTRDIVYILTNPAMPGMIKIGKTTQVDMHSRMAQLYTTGVPVPFDCVYACEVEDYTKVEQALHTAFGDRRVNPRREFFEVQPERVLAVLKLLAIADVTPRLEKELSLGLDSDDKQSAENLKRSRPNINFLQMGIPVGAILVYKDDGTIQVTVVDGRHVEYKGVSCSLTKATRDILGLELGFPLRPTPYWTYQGRSLIDIYEDWA